MPGFGHGPFGRNRAGAFNWSRQVLWDYLPELHRRTDAESGDGALEKWTDAIGPAFEGPKDLIRDFGDLRDPLTVRTQYTNTEVLTLGSKIQVVGATLQRGISGAVDGFGQFSAPTARFFADAIGKEIKVSRSSKAGNNTVVYIASVVNPTKVTTWPVLEQDSGLTWEVREPSAPSGTTTTVDVEFGDVSSVSPGWILFDGYSEYEVLARQTLKSTTEREGSDGSIDASGRFVLQNGKFTMEDIGKRITLFDSTTDENNNGLWEIRNVITDLPTFTVVSTDALLKQVVISGFDLTNTATPVLTGTSFVIASGAAAGTYTVAGVLNATTLNVHESIPNSSSGTVYFPATGSFSLAVLDTALTTDSGPITWALRPRPRLTLRTTGAAVRGIVEQAGFDALVSTVTSTTATLWMPSGVFDSEDIGKWLTLRGPGVNVGQFVVSGIVTNKPNYVVVTVSGGAPSIQDEATYLTWELRTTSLIGNTTEVQVRASSLLVDLAQDFGIEVDTRENDDRQRSWVRNVTRWINIKGTAKAYRVLGTISGYNIVPYAVFHLADIIAKFIESVDQSSVYEIGSTDPLKYGIDGRMINTVPATVDLLASHYTITDIASQEITVSGINLMDENHLVQAIDPVYLRIPGTGALVRYTVASVTSDSKFKVIEPIGDQSGPFVGFAIFPDTTGVHFLPSDIGKQIRIRNSTLGTGSPPSNNNRYDIIEVDRVAGSWARLNTVSVIQPDPDPLSDLGYLTWNVVRLYTTQPPITPYLPAGLDATFTMPGSTVSMDGSVTYTANNTNYPGILGNHIRVRHIAGTGLLPVVYVTKATTAIPGAAPGGSGVVTYTAKTGGLGSNSIQVSHTTGSLGIVESVPNKTIVVSFPLGTTSAAVATYVNTTFGSALVTATPGTSGGLGAAGLHAPVYLTGGLDDVTVEVPPHDPAATPPAPDSSTQIAAQVLSTPEAAALVSAVAPSPGTERVGLRDYANLIGPDFNTPLMNEYINAKATLVVTGTGPSPLLDTYVIYTAITAGDAGNAIQVEHLAGSGVLSVGVTGNKITVTLAAGGSFAVDVADKVNADPIASTMVRASFGGTTGTEYAGTQTVVNMSGGATYFHPLRFNWYPGYRSTIPIGVLTISTVSQISTNLWDVSLKGPGYPVVSTNTSGINKVILSGFTLTKPDYPIATGTQFVIEGGAAAGTYTIASIDAADTLTTVETLPTSTTGMIYFPLDIVSQVSFDNWWMLDSSGRKYFLETVPVRDGSVCHTQVFSSAIPTVGAVSLTYDGVFQPSCDYCAASKVLLIIEPDEILGESGVAVEQAQNRMLTRIEQVTPAHVEAFPRFRIHLVSYVAPWIEPHWKNGIPFLDPDEVPVPLTTPPTSPFIRATFSTKIRGGTLVAPVTAYYDDILGDAILYSPPPTAGPLTSGGHDTVEDFVMIKVGGQRSSSSDGISWTPYPDYP